MILSPETEAAARTHSVHVPPAAVSTSVALRLCRFDGRTRVVSLRDAEGWLPMKRLRWTRPLLSELRERGAREVLLKRGFTRGRVPLTWFPEDGED